MAKKGFTPIIGLAVVVALAMVAVFGAMSLAPTPVAAQVDGTGLCLGTDGGFIPDQGVALGSSERYSFEGCFAADDTNATGVRTSDPSIATAVLGDNGNDTAVGDILVTGVSLGTVTIEVATLGTGQKSFQLTVYNTGPMAEGTIPDQSIGISGVGSPGVDFRAFNLSKYFTGSDIEYTASSSDDNDVDAIITSDDMATTVAAEDGMYVRVTTLGIGGVAGDSVTVTITAKNSVEGETDEQRFKVYVDGAPSVLAEDEGGELETDDPANTQVGLDDLREGATRTIDVSDYFSGTRNMYTVHAATNGAAPARNIAVPTDAFGSNSVDAEIEEGTSMLKLTGTERGLATYVLVAAANGGGTDFVALKVRVTRNAAPERTVEVAGSIDLTGLPSFAQSSDDPGDSANYTVKFVVDDGDNEESTVLNTRQEDLIIEFHEDYSIPSSIRNTSVAITTEGGMYPVPGQNGNDSKIVTTRTFTPEDVTVDGEKVLISLGDMDEQDDRFDYDIDEGELITVHFRQSAGITNPTEFGGYNLVEIEFGDAGIKYNEDVDPATPVDFETKVVRKLTLSEGDGGLGDVITATGKGYKNGTTLTVFRDLMQVVMWNDPATSGVPSVANRVPLPPSMVKAYNDRMAVGAAMSPPAVYGNVPAGIIITDADGSASYTSRVNSATGVGGYAMAFNRNLDLGEDVLCVVGSIGSDDVGKCEFTVTHPTFSGGLNYVNAVDGRDGYDLTADDFLLKASITASPAGGSPGETIVIQVVDFPREQVISMVEISRRPLTCGGCGGSADSTGADNFQIVIPNWVKAGAQELRVTSGTGSSAVRATAVIDLLGPQINVTPGTVLANQRISLVGTGFSPSAVIANDEDPDEVAPPEISIGGRPIHESRINDGDSVKVDNGGNWSASVDLPLAEATTADGERALRVSDSRGRTGVAVVSIPARGVTVTPESGRVGTIAVVRGVGFPSKNDEGSSFNVQIVYDASNGNTTTVSAEPDASGRFETQLRIPTTAAIPSSNSIKVSFFDIDGVSVVTTVAHEVPEGIITLSETSGGPGSTVSVSGEGFKSFVPISLVKVGTLDVTPAPKPSTDGNGMMNFDILIPGLDVGIQTIEVSVGRTTSSTGFTVTESGVNPGDIKEVAPSLEDLGDNFVNIWNFNNDTKAWSFYDGQEGSDLTHMISGETYLIQIKSTVEVILNGDTRNLTCVGANCWNQIVW